MAKIRVRLFGVFRMDTHLSDEKIEAERIVDIFDILNNLAGARFNEKKKLNPNLEKPEPISLKDALVYVNGERCRKKKQKLSDGDEIMLLSPASGG